MESLSGWLVIFISASLVNNVVLVQFLGLCPFMGVSNRLETAVGMSLATTFVLTLASATSYLVFHYLLVPWDLAFLRTLVFMLVIAAMVQLTERVVQMVSPLLFQVLGLFLPLITSNCAVLGVALACSDRINSFVEAVVYGFATGVGFCVALTLFSALRERVAGADVPAPFRGTPVAMMTAGLMSLAFMGLNGLGA